MKANVQYTEIHSKIVGTLKAGNTVEKIVGSKNPDVKAIPK